MKRDLVHLCCAGVLLASAWAISPNIYASEMELKQSYDNQAKSLLAQYGKMAIHKVVLTNEGIEILSRLVSEHGIDIDLPDEHGNTVLIRAVVYGVWGPSGMMTTILSLGANVNYQGQYGQTALIYASQKGAEEKIKLLLEHGALIDLSDERGHSALSWAARKGERGFDSVKLLLAGGADVNHQSVDGDTPLMLASKIGDVAIIKLLFEHGAKVDLKAKNGDVAIGKAFGGLEPKRKRKPEAIRTLRAYDPQGYCFYHTQSQILDVRDILMSETGSTNPDEEAKIIFWTDFYNFLSTFDVGECSPQYRFIFTRAKVNIGTFLSMYHEWKKGSFFSDLTADRMNEQRRAKLNSFDKLFAIRAPY